MPESNDKPAVGWIGLGDQGTPMAQAITDNGHPLPVWARRPESLKALDGHGFIPHSSVAEMAAVSDVVGLCLREDSDNVQVATDGGLLAAMRRGTVLVNGLDLPIPAMLQVLLSGSASSYALQAIGPSITASNVHHLVPLELIDVGLFSGAVAALGDAARPVIDRATAGAEELDQLTAIVLG